MKEKRTHNEARDLEEMTFTKPEIETLIIKWESEGKKGVLIRKCSFFYQQNPCFFRCKPRGYNY